MSGGYGGWAPAARPRGEPSAVRLVAASLLVVVAALAVGGSFGEILVDRGAGYSYNGWQYFFDDPDLGLGATPPQDGIVLAVGAVLTVVAAIMLALSARRADDPAAPRLVGVGSVMFVLGDIGSVWLYAGRATLDGQSDPSLAGRSVGTGGWVLLAAAVVALAVVGLLLVPRRTPAAGPGWPGGGPPGPYGAGYAYAPTLVNPVAPDPRLGWAPPTQPPPR